MYWAGRTCRRVQPNAPRPADWPSIAAVAGAVTPAQNRRRPQSARQNVHNTGRVIPGPFAGVMGHVRDPWLIEASPFNPVLTRVPEYEFDHQQRPIPRGSALSPNLSLPPEFAGDG